MFSRLQVPPPIPGERGKWCVPPKMNSYNEVMGGCVFFLILNHKYQSKLATRQANNLLRIFSPSACPDTCLNWLQMIGFLWVPLFTAYLVFWWCCPGENSIQISLNKTHDCFCLTLIIWTFSKHVGAKHQVDTLNTVENMCSFWREVGSAVSKGLLRPKQSSEFG